LVTACGPDLDLSPLEGIPLACAASATSTTFENVYGSNGRTQFIRAQAAPLTADSIPPDWRHAPIVHLAPLTREIQPSLAAELDAVFLGVTPQGWLRHWDEDGRVRHDVAAWPEAAEVLPRASAVVLSLEDIGRDWAVAERWARLAATLVITQGAEGCTVFRRGQGARQFLAPRRAEVDPTGAGDVFAAAFFINYYETEDAWGSARFANQVAALSVTRHGLDGVPTSEEVGYCRTRSVA
jgi:sugar/nucleoside kinase (ribokinase family)